MKETGIILIKKISLLLLLFYIYYLAVDWTDIIKSEKKDIDFSFECFFKKFNLILGKYLPLKKLTKQK